VHVDNSEKDEIKFVPCTVEEERQQDCKKYDTVKQDEDGLM